MSRLSSNGGSKRIDETAVQDSESLLDTMEGRLIEVGEMLGHARTADSTGATEQSLAGRTDMKGDAAPITGRLAEHQMVALQGRDHRRGSGLADADKIGDRHQAAARLAIEKGEYTELRNSEAAAHIAHDLA